MSDKAQGLIYSLVARGNVVLAEYATSSSGNFVTVSRVVLEKINPAEDGRQSYVYDQYVVFFLFLFHQLN